MNEDADLHVPSLIASEQCRLLLPSRPEYIGGVAEFLSHKTVLCGACDERHARKVAMALHEAISNSMIHGNLELSSALKERADASFAEELVNRAGDSRLAGRLVDVRFEYDGCACRWIIVDEGKGFDFERFLSRAPDVEPGAILASGRGLLILRSFMTDVRYEDRGRRLILGFQRKTGAERRAEERVPTSEAVEVAPLRRDGQVDWDAAFTTVATNVSEGGMALLHEKLVSGEQIMISVRSGGRAVTIPAEIRHARALSGALMEIGCRFITSAPAAPPAAQVEAVQVAINQLIEKYGAEAPVDERREHQRAYFNECVEIEFAGNSTMGYTRNLSRGGVAFVTTIPIVDDFTLSFAARANLPAMRLRARVTRCTRIKDGLYDIGARFLELVR